MLRPARACGRVLACGVHTYVRVIHVVNAGQLDGARWFLDPRQAKLYVVGQLKFLRQLFLLGAPSPREKACRRNLSGLLLEQPVLGSKNTVAPIEHHTVCVTLPRGICLRAQGLARGSTCETVHAHQPEHTHGPMCVRGAL